jgi:hypothetical protein
VGHDEANRLALPPLRPPQRDVAGEVPPLPPALLGVDPPGVGRPARVVERTAPL